MKRSRSSLSRAVFHVAGWASLCVVAASMLQGRAQAAADTASCTSLLQRSTQRIEVQTAEWVTASQAGAPRRGGGAPGGRAAPMPEHCLVRLMVDQRASGLPDLTYGTGIEVRLPRNWNGRLLVQGGGGLNGTLGIAVGNVAGFPSALERGYAVISTDGGHQGRNNVDARFGADQQARLDFAYGAIATATREGKAVLADFYGRSADHSYFMGCSTGGREAMLAAQRLPLEFDGVVSGNAAWNFTRLVANQVFSLQTVTRIAPPGPDGKPDLSQAFTETQLKAASAAILKQCDALDGLADGMINDFKACRFSPHDLVCGKTGAPAGAACLATQQADGLKEIFGGAHDSSGESLYGWFAWDTGIAQPAWRSMHLGNPGGQPANATLGGDVLRNYLMTPAQPGFDALEFDFDRDMGRLAETAAINDANGTLHGTFAGRGGKLISYNGLSDQAMATGPLIDWYERLSPVNATGAPDDWARLFLVPGMTHCGGGQSTDRFDMLEAIRAWVEDGKAPDRIIATGSAFPGVSRPLCPYPKVARYDGGDTSNAASFSCR